MNILVTGANGQLGKCFQNIINIQGNGKPDSFVGEKDYWIFAGREELNVEDDKAVTEYIGKNHINVVVNCAAYTNVAQAENENDLALRGNCFAAENLAEGCKKVGAVLIHISTDYVYDGMQNTPYTPDAECNPLNFYGQSKLEGEFAIKRSGCKYLIFRTSWLYSEYGKNFVKTMVKRSLANETSAVVYDQIGCPTYAGDLAWFIYKIITDNDAENRNLSRTGIYHFCNKGVASWYDLAHLTYLLTGDVDNVTCRRTTDSELVKRPSYTVMDTSLTEEIFQRPIPHWEDSFTKAIKKIVKNVQDDTV